MRMLKTALLLIFICSTWSAAVDAAQTVSVQFAGQKKTTPAKPPANGAKAQSPKPQK
jgi:hypothetical protein